MTHSVTASNCSNRTPQHRLGERVSLMRRWRGRWPLGSDEFSESGVELGSGRWVNASVWSAENEFAGGVALNRPACFVEEPVVEPA
jgi:hypothetical protein